MKFNCIVIIVVIFGCLLTISQASPLSEDLDFSRFPKESDSDESDLDFVFPEDLENESNIVFPEDLESDSDFVFPEDSDSDEIAAQIFNLFKFPKHSNLNEIVAQILNFSRFPKENSGEEVAASNEASV